MGEIHDALRLERQMNLYVLTYCNPDAMREEDISDTIDFALDPWIRVFSTLEKAKARAERIACGIHQAMTADQFVAPAWTESTYTVGELTYASYTFEIDGDVYLVREAPVDFE